MDIIDEWNEIANERLVDRLNGNDISYNEVLLPTIISNTIKFSNSRSKILDFGCGTGELTYEIAKQNLNVIGIDISSSSIKLAKEYFRHPKLEFVNSSLFDVNFVSCFDIIVANMSLMDTENLIDILKKINVALKEDGKMLVIITHPCYWPIYWNYCNDSDFNYMEECKITQTYRTRNKIFEGHKTSHFHHPLSFYLNGFGTSGFQVLHTEEFNNPNDNVWYPRFLYFELKKNQT